MLRDKSTKTNRLLYGKISLEMVVTLWTADWKVAGSNPALDMTFHMRTDFTKTHVASKRIEVERWDRYQKEALEQGYPTMYCKGGFIKVVYELSRAQQP